MCTFVWSCPQNHSEELFISYRLCRPCVSCGECLADTKLSQVSINTTYRVKSPLAKKVDIIKYVLVSSHKHYFVRNRLTTDGTSLLSNPHRTSWTWQYECYPYSSRYCITTPIVLECYGLNCSAALLPQHQNGYETCCMIELIRYPPNVLSHPLNLYVQICWSPDLFCWKCWRYELLSYW